jgi:hypothetical protein
MSSALEEGEASFSSKEELALLLRRDEPLYAVLDAARDPAVLRLLRDSGEEAQSLYSGRRSEQLAEVAPYLARVPVGSRLFDGLINEGWGRSFGVLVACDAPFAELRRHLRRFLVVQTEERQALYFRFYDPRVLRPFLEAAADEERRAFFGPVSAILLEGRRDGTLLRRVRVGPAAPRAEAPWELFTIREAQMEVFSREIEALFVERMVARLGEAMGRWAPPPPDPGEAIRRGIARARRHGLSVEGDVERFLGLMATLGPSFDQRLPWARTILRREDIDGPRKLNRMERRVRQRSAGGAT